MRQVEQLYRMVRPARETGAVALVTEAARIVGKAVVPDFEAERSGCAAPRSRTEREIGFRQAMPAARFRPCGFEKGRQHLGIDRAERRNAFEPALSVFRLVDKDMVGGDAVVGRVVHFRGPSSGSSRRTIPDPQRLRADRRFLAGSRMGVRYPRAGVDRVPCGSSEPRTRRGGRTGTGSGLWEEHGRAGGLPRLQRAVDLRRLRGRFPPRWPCGHLISPSRRSAIAIRPRSGRRGAAVATAPLTDGSATGDPGAKPAP